MRPTLWGPPPLVAGAVVDVDNPPPRSLAGTPVPWRHDRAAAERAGLMALRTSDEFRDGLRDARRVIYRGEAVADVVEHPELRTGVDHSAICFDISFDPELQHLAVDGEHSAYFRIPRTAADIEQRGRLIEATSALGGGSIVLKEVGSDALFALLRALEGDALARARNYHAFCRESDAAIAVAQTDVKGDRSLAPQDQADPDLY